MEGWKNGKEELGIDGQRNRKMKRKKSKVRFNFMTEPWRAQRINQSGGREGRGGNRCAWLSWDMYTNTVECSLGLTHSALLVYSTCYCTSSPSTYRHVNMSVWVYLILPLVHLDAGAELALDVRSLEYLDRPGNHGHSNQSWPQGTGKKTKTELRH